MIEKERLVYYTYRVPAQARKLLTDNCQLVEHDNVRPPSKEQLIQNVQEAVALCCLVTDTIDAEIINSSRRLKVISLAGRGLDKIDVHAATARNIWVANAVESVEPTADLAWALLLGVARKVNAADSFVRSGRFTGWVHPAEFDGSMVAGKTLGIIGMGQLGVAIARRAQGFNMTVLYFDTYRYDEISAVNYNATALPRDELLRRSDFICLASPLTERTFHQISEKEVALMKPTAYLINPSRGSEVDEHAIAEALAEGRLAGYAADVFEMEDSRYPQRPKYVNENLLKLADRTIFTPHLGTAIPEIRAEIMKIQALNVLQALQGKRPTGAVNRVHPRIATIPD